MEGCRRIGIKNVITSRVDKATGKYNGKNCRGIEKVNRYRGVYNGQKVEQFYSDSYSDEHMAKLAESAFIVKKGKTYPWGMK